MTKGETVENTRPPSRNIYEAKIYRQRAQMWKSSFTITNLQMKLGGYTAKKSCFLNMHEVQSLEEAILLVFLFV